MGVFAFTVSSVASAMYPPWAFNNVTVGPAATGQVMCQQMTSVLLQQVGVTSATLNSVTGAGPGAPTTVGQVANCNWTTNGGALAGSTSASVSGALSCSATSGNLDLLTTLGGSSGYTSTGAFCYQGCEYVNGNATLQVGTTTNRFAGAAVPSGQTCGLGGNANQATSQNGNCIIKAGVSVCADAPNSVALVQPTAGAVMDTVPVNTPSTPNTCDSYADGAMACNAGTNGTTLQSPPAPSTSSSTNVATAEATVTNTATGNVIEYFPPATVTASKNYPNPNNTGGTPLGSGTGTGTGTGSSGTGPGDCMDAASAVAPASNSNCTGTVPSLTRTDTVQSNLQAFYTGLASAPIVAALTSISSGMPSGGSCPSASVTLTSLASHSFDFMTSACSVFATDLSTLIAVSDTVWALIGVMIVMSA